MMLASVLGFFSCGEGLCFTLDAMVHSLQCRGDASFCARLVGMNSYPVFLPRYGDCRLFGMSCRP